MSVRSAPKDPWVKIRTCLRQDPHVIRLATTMKLPKVTIVGALTLMWSIAYDAKKRGLLEGWDAEMLDAEIGVPGFSAAAMAGLDGKGGDAWLEVAEEGRSLLCPRFEKYMGEKAIKTDENTDRQRRLRDGKDAAKRDGPGSVAPDARQQRDSVARSARPDRDRDGDKTEEPSPSVLRTDTPPASPGGEFPRLADGPEVGQPAQEPDAPSATPAPGGLRGADLELARGMEAIAAGDARRAPGAVPDAPASRLTTARKGKPRAHGFEPFYAAYPRKEAPDAAERAFVRAVGRLRSRDPTLSAEAAAARIGERAAAFAKSDVARGPREFIPHPATWLNDGRFDDDDGEWRRDGDERGSGGGGGRGDAGAGQAPRAAAPGAGPGDRGRAALSRGAGAVRRT